MAWAELCWKGNGVRGECFFPVLGAQVSEGFVPEAGVTAGEGCKARSRVLDQKEGAARAS